MKDGFLIFDTHTHAGTARHSGRSTTADDLLRNMDLHGVDRSVVIPFPVVHDCRLEHDLIGRAVKEHPDRLTGAACLDPYLPLEDFRAEVRRCREAYGFAALKLQPQYHGLNPFSDASDFFFETALEEPDGSHLPHRLGIAFLAAIVVHDAGAQISRFDDRGGALRRRDFLHEAILAALFCPNIVLEMSSLMPHQVLEVLAQVPAERLMIGSDLPENTGTEVGKILTLDIPAECKRAVLSGTAHRVFGDC